MSGRVRNRADSLGTDLEREVSGSSILLSAYPHDDPSLAEQQNDDDDSLEQQQQRQLNEESVAEEEDTTAKEEQQPPLPFVKSWTLDILINVGFLSIVLSLLVFTAIAGRLHGKPVGSLEHYTVLRDISNKIATFFPIIFAAIIGRLVKKIASYRLERGCTLGVLERIAGSQTLGNTIGTQLEMRSFDLLTVILLATWSLSPIGSQGSLQFLSTTVVPVSTSVPVTYFNTRSQKGWIFGNQALGLAYPLVALYDSSLLSPPLIQQASVDLWGNLKIPDLKHLQGNSTANSTGWLDVSSQSNVTYSSLLGIPLGWHLLPAAGTTNFTIESAYFSLDCLNSTVGSRIEFTPLFPDSDANSTFQKRQAFTFGPQPPSNIYYGLKTNVTFSLAINGFMNVSDDRGILQSTTGGADILLNDTSQWDARTLLFQSQNTQSTVRAFCTTTMTYVESAVTCAAAGSAAGGGGKSCAVTAMRPSVQPHPSPNFTDWNIGTNFYTFTNLFIDTVNELASGKAPRTVGPGSTATELYIQDPSLVSSASLKTADLSQVDLATLGIGLQQLVNTFWWGGIDPRTTLLGISPGITLGPLLQTTGTHSEPQIHYLINWGWLTVFLIATLVMLAATITGAIYGALLRGPELIGYCSSLTRGTPYVSGSYTLSTLQGIERSKELSKMKLRLVDVEDENEEAGVLLVAEDDGMTRRAGLMKRRLYR